MSKDADDSSEADDFEDDFEDDDEEFDDEEGE